jgi:hypothetical protein
MTKLSATLLIGAIWLTATTARADQACLQSAKSVFAGCKTGCKNAFLDDRANCKGVTPGCLSACIDTRDSCISGAEASLESCEAACDPIVANAKPTCKAQCGCDAPANPCRFDPCYVHCLDPYEQIRFSCRDDCRNQFQLNGGPAAVAQCKTDFHACVAACPAP